MVEFGQRIMDEGVFVDTEFGIRHGGRLGSTTSTIRPVDAVDQFYGR
jgi:hypothetical protein